MFSRKWRQVYERLPLERKDRSLAEISGFDKYCDDYQAFGEEIFVNLVRDAAVTKGARVCEIGCGCGDKLGKFYRSGYRCFGIDYSKNMIQRAKQEMPKARLEVGEAARLPFADNSMDLVFSYSVFIYFENWRYTERVLKEMYRIAKPKGVVCIWDVPDIKEKARVEAFRGKSQKGYEHTYYDANEFLQWFKTRAIKDVSVGYRPMSFYKHSAFRFNMTAHLDKNTGKRL